MQWHQHLNKAKRNTRDARKPIAAWFAGARRPAKTGYGVQGVRRSKDATGEPGWHRMAKTNPYAGLADAVNNEVTWQGRLGASAVLTMESLRAAVEEWSNPRKPQLSYDFSFRCGRCKRVGYAARTFERCPMCNSKDFWMGDRGWPELGMRRLYDITKYDATMRRIRSVARRRARRMAAQ
jgi:hypothetical protein